MNNINRVHHFLRFLIFAVLIGLSLAAAARAAATPPAQRTDRFGLYRMDGLPIGTYMLRPKPGILPYSRQDLQLPLVLEDATTGSHS